MNETNMSDDQAGLEDVLNAYVSDNRTPSKQALSEWMHRHPQYKQELVNFTVNWIKMEKLPPAADIDEVDEKVLVQQGMAIVRKLLNQQRDQISAGEVENGVIITGLLEEGGKLNLSLREIAARCQLGIAVIRKLDRRLITYPSIPPLVIDRIAQAISLDFESISHYLSEPPKLAKGIRYRADERPTVTEKQKFFEAVRIDTTMSEKDKSYWLAFEADNREG